MALQFPFVPCSQDSSYSYVFPPALFFFSLSFYSVSASLYTRAILAPPSDILPIHSFVGYRVFFIVLDTAIA